MFISSFTCLNYRYLHENEYKIITHALQLLILFEEYDRADQMEDTRDAPVLTVRDSRPNFDAHRRTVGFR